MRIKTFAVIALMLVVAAVGVLAVSDHPVEVAAGLAFTAVAGFSFVRQHNIGAYIKVYRGAANTSLTAAGSGDNTAIVGAIIDRFDANGGKSAVFAVPFTATLAAGKKLFLKSVIVEHGDDSGLSDAATLSTLEDSTGTAVATSAGGGTVTGCKNYDVDLSAAKRYVRLTFTPDLDASGTDTAAVSATVVMGGADTLPV